MSLAALALTGCHKMHTTDLTPLDKAGVQFNDVEQLRGMDLSDAEVQKVAGARQSGVSDQDCIELVRIAHARHQPFTDGETAPMLLGAGIAEPTVMQLARLNQLGIWAGEAQAMHLARLSDEVILAVAARRAAGQPVLSGAKIASLQEVGYTQGQLLGEINSGTTDDQADAIIARHNVASSRGFVHQRGRRNL